MSTTAFIGNFRLSKDAFLYVLEKLDQKLKKPTLCTSIPNIVKLATTLRFCAQGSYQLSVGNEANNGLAQSTTSLVFKEVLNALEAILCSHWIKFSFTNEEVNEAKIKFCGRSGFPGVVGCVDGTYVKIVSPKKEVQHVYYNRKGFHSLN